MDDLKNILKMDEQELHVYVNSLIKEATDYRKRQRDVEYTVNMAHYEGFAWNLTVLDADSPFLIKSDINHVKNAVDLRLGSLCASDYLGELYPKSMEDSANIGILQNSYMNEWAVIDADDIIKDVIKDGARLGDGYVEFGYNPNIITGSTKTRNEGQITLKYLHTAGVYLDPNSDCFEDCNYLVSKMRKSKDWIKREHEDWLLRLKDKNASLNGILSHEDAGEIYKGRDYTNEQDKSVLISTVYIKTKSVKDIDITDPITGEITKDTVSGTKILIYYVINDIIVGEMTSYPFDTFPIIKFTWEKMPQSPYGIPLMRGLTTPQKVVNLIESAANNIAMHYSVPSWAVSDDSGLDIDEFASLAQAMGVVYKVTGDPTKAIAAIRPPELNAQLISIKDSFINNIFTYAGATGAYMGNIGTAGATAQGTNDAINRATIIDNNPIVNIQKFVELMVRTLIKYMVHYYPGRTIYTRKLNEGAKSLSEKFTFKEFTLEAGLDNIDYDFAIDLFIKTVADRNRRYNIMKEIYTLEKQYKDPNAILNSSDLAKAAQLDNYTELFERYRNMSDDSLNEKASLMLEIMQIGETRLPNGEFLVPAEELQQGIIDILDDKNDLKIVQGIISKYEQYQEAITNFKNNMNKPQTVMQQ